MIKIECDQTQHFAKIDNENFLIVNEAIGAREKFWIERRYGATKPSSNINSNKMLIKFNRNIVSCENWGEIFASKIASVIDFPCVQYEDVMVYSYSDPSIFSQGVMCGSYKEGIECTEYSACDVQTKLAGISYDDYLNKPNAKINTIDGIIESLKNFNNGAISSKDITDCRNDLVKQALFDFIIAQSDRHWNNIAFLAYVDKDKKIRIKKTKSFDNGCMAFLNRKALAIEGMSKEIGKLGKDSPYLVDKLSKYCPMLGISTPVTSVQVSNKSDKIKKIVLKDDGVSREIFLSELTNEIVHNPVILDFYKNIKIKMNTKGEKGLDFESITEQLFKSGSLPPKYVVKMISDVVGHQFETIDKLVMTKLNNLKNEKR